MSVLDGDEGSTHCIQCKSRSSMLERWYECAVGSTPVVVLDVCDAIQMTVKILPFRLNKHFLSSSFIPSKE